MRCRAIIDLMLSRRRPSIKPILAQHFVHKISVLDRINTEQRRTIILSYLVIRRFD